MGLLSGNMITAIFFDIGGVLLNIHPERTLQYLSDCTDVSVDEIEKRFPMDAHDEYEKGHLSNKEWFIAFKNALPQPCCLKESDFWHAWQLLLGKEKRAVQLLKTLCETYSIWLLSNTNPKHIQEEIKKRYSFPNFIDGAVYSFNVGYRKPEENIYRIATDNAKALPKNCIFIDDQLENVQAAIRIGFIGIHFSSYKRLKADLLKNGIII